MRTRAPAAHARTREAAGVREFAAGYDLWLVDQWGVLHDGRAPFPGAVDCLRRLARAGKRVVLLSNSGRRVAANVARLAEMGIGPALYTAMITSGELARLKLAVRAAPFARGRRCLLLGSEGDDALIAGLDVARAEGVDDADFMLQAGVDAALEEGADALFAAACARGLPLVCANPDLLRFTEAGIGPGSGEYARRYEALGGSVHYIGKPHAEIYDYCLALHGSQGAEQRVVAVGDSMAHDVAGGAAAGIATAFVTGGVHREAFAGLDAPARAARLAALSREYGAAPDWAVPEFTW